MRRFDKRVVYGIAAWAVTLAIYCVAGMGDIVDDNQSVYVADFGTIGWVLFFTVIAALIFFAGSSTQRFLDKHKARELSNIDDSSTDFGKITTAPKSNQHNSTAGIGTGVIKLFQQIKDNIGEEKTLTLGYQHLLALACEHLEFDAGAAFLLDHRGQYCINGSYNINRDPQEKYILDNSGIIADLLTRDIPKYIIDLTQITGNCSSLFAGYKAAWLVPLLPQGMPAGVLIFAHKEIPQSREDYYPKLDFVSIAAGWFFENNRKERLIDKENKKNSMLVNTSLAISSSLDLDEVCQVLASNLGRAFGCSYSYVMLSNENGRNMNIQTYFSERGSEIFGPGEKEVDISEMVWLNELIVLGSPVLLEPYELNRLSRRDKEILKIEGSVKTLIAPLKHAGKLTGILFMVEQRSAERTRLDDEVVDLCAALVAQAAAAIENARLYTMVSDRVAQITTMFDVGQALNTDLDLIPFIERVLAAISRNFKMSTCSFFLRDFDSNELYLASSMGDFPHERLTRRIRVGLEGITGHAVSMGKPINVGDVTIDPRFIESTGKTASELAVPVILHGTVVGVLDVESETKYAFSAREEDLLKSLVDQVAVAIEKIKLKRLEKERSNKLALTNILAKKLSGEQDQGQFLSEAVKGLTEGFGFDFGAIFLPDEQGNLILARQSCRWGQGFEPGLILGANQGLPGKVATARMASHLDQIDNDDLDNALEGVKSRYCLPLITGNSLLGVLDIQDRRAGAFSPIDISTLQTFAEFLAVAMNNIRLYNETINKAERLSLVDQINQAISTTLELEELFGRIVKSLSEITGYQWAALFYKNEEGYYIRSSYIRNNLEEITRIVLPPSNELNERFDEIIKGGPPRYSSAEDFAKSPDLYNFLQARGTNYLAFCPVKHQGTVKGILVIGSPNPDGFKQQDRILLHDVSMHLEIALNNATLYGEIKSAYDSLHETQEKLFQSEKFKALGEVAAGIAHDFKNILAAVKGRAELLKLRIEQQEEIDRDALLKGLHIIDKSAADGVNILSKINEFSRTGRKTNLDKINLREVIEDTLEMTRPKWENPNCQKTISVTSNYSGDMYMLGDRSEMVEVFSNLIINAVDASGPTGSIDINAHSAGDKIIIQVSDTGSGIDPQSIKRIFDPFYTTKGRIGTGLGLTMVYAIIQRHGGEISVDSKPGLGTTFTIKLPALTIKFGESNLNVLIVEKGSKFKVALGNLLNGMGITSHWASTLHEAVNLLKNNVVNVAMIDIDSLGDAGWTTVKEIHKLAPDISILPIAENIDSNDPEQMKINGITGAIHAGTDAGDLGRLIRKLNAEKANAR